MSAWRRRDGTRLAWRADPAPAAGFRDDVFTVDPRLRFVFAEPAFTDADRDTRDFVAVAFAPFAREVPAPVVAARFRRAPAPAPPRRVRVFFAEDPVFVWRILDARTSVFLAREERMDFIPPLNAAEESGSSVIATSCISPHRPAGRSGAVVRSRISGTMTPVARRRPGTGCA